MSPQRQQENKRAKISAYIERYGEVEAQKIKNWPDGICLARGIVIPAYNESPQFLHSTLSKLNRSERNETLVIVVINRPEHDVDITPSQALLDTLIGANKIVWQRHSLTLIEDSKSYLLVVDRFSNNNTIPTKQGVGLARKIGADIACKLFVTGKLQSPWLYSTDADATLAQNYFSQENNAGHDSAAQVFNFKHSAQQTELAIGEATQQYENAISYYAEALRWAGSPYGFCTLGSAFALNLYHYAVVRGFPKRPAGEDFYLLNKIAKVGDILRCDDIVIRIQARLSNRVPFGTGPAIAGILKLENKQSYLYYNPAIFVKLKQLIGTVKEKNIHMEEADIDDPQVQKALAELKFSQFLSHGKTHCKHSQDWLKHFHQWFDAFKVLKFVHYLQGSTYPKLPLETCLKQFTVTKNNAND